MRGANNKMGSSDIDIFMALYTADRTQLRLSPNWKLSHRVEKGEGADVSYNLNTHTLWRQVHVKMDGKIIGCIT